MDEPLHLTCQRCGTTYATGLYLRGCDHCRRAGVVSPLFVTYDEIRIRAAWESRQRHDSGMWAFASVLPLPHSTPRVTLGEGSTPLLHVSRLGGRDIDVHLKLESHNPTGSFKDRLNSVAVSMARYHRVRGIACSSTGNHGVSLAAYAAAADLQSVVLLPEEAPETAAREIRQYGGTAIVTRWDDRARWLTRLVDDAGWAVSARNFPYNLGNPYGLEGYKTIAYELVRQLNGRPPSTIFVPTCGGDGIYGLWRGFKELRQAEIIDRPPRLIACQPERSASVARALAADADHVDPVDLAISCALSLTDRQAGDHALWAIRESSGAAITLTEDELREAVRLLARAGLCAEPAAAAGVAGFFKNGEAEPPVVCLVTAAGHRWLEA
jgi:threonine synthase